MYVTLNELAKQYSIDEADMYDFISSLDDRDERGIMPHPKFKTDLMMSLISKGDIYPLMVKYYTAPRDLDQSTKIYDNAVEAMAKYFADMVKATHIDKKACGEKDVMEPYRMVDKDWFDDMMGDFILDDVVARTKSMLEL